ncbi:MAG: nucleotidyltransferase family protein [Candidatus Aenigmatarchaeota archaeon]
MKSNRFPKELELKKIEKKIIPILKRYNIKKASVFGSFVKGKAKNTSDIDILVEFKQKKTLLDLVSLKMKLEEVLERKVDVLTYKSLHPLLADRILKEQKLFYEKRSKNIH